MGDHTPLTLKLSPRRRQVVMLRAAGWSYAEIGRRLGVASHTVKNDLQAVAETLIPGVTDLPVCPKAKVLRLVYVLGVLDGGGDPTEVADHLDALVTRADLLALSQRTRRPAPPH